MRVMLYNNWINFFIDDITILAKEETEKQNKQEAEISKFTNSLDVDSQSLEDDDSEKIIIDVDEVVERRRVIPTLPMSRKPIHGKKRGGGIGEDFYKHF